MGDLLLRPTANKFYWGLKNEQCLDVQVQKLIAVGCEEIFKEKISGAKDDRPQLKALMNKLRKGDTLCVVRLDRLG